MFSIFMRYACFAGLADKHCFCPRKVYLCFDSSSHSTHPPINHLLPLPSFLPLFFSLSLSLLSLGQSVWAGHLSCAVDAVRKGRSNATKSKSHTESAQTHQMITFDLDLSTLDCCTARPMFGCVCVYGIVSKSDSIHLVCIARMIARVANSSFRFVFSKLVGQLLCFNLILF